MAVLERVADTFSPSVEDKPLLLSLFSNSTNPHYTIAVVNILINYSLDAVLTTVCGKQSN